MGSLDGTGDVKKLSDLAEDIRDAIMDYQVRAQSARLRLS